MDGWGDHYSFMSQPVAAEANFHMFCVALKPLLSEHPDCLQELAEIEEGFPEVMQNELETMWAAKLGLNSFHHELFRDLVGLMMKTSVDYTVFFRELSLLPDNIETLKKSFYQSPAYVADPKSTDERWTAWLERWRALAGVGRLTAHADHEVSSRMKRVNPKYCLRDWQVVSAYQKAETGNYELLRELQVVMTQPYDEQPQSIEHQYYRLKPMELFGVGGASHYSCSS